MRPGVGWIVLLSTLIVTVVSLSVWIYTVESHQNDALRSIMCYTERYILKDRQIPEKQKQQTIRFYNKALEEAHLPLCQ